MYSLVTRTQSTWKSKRSGELNKLNTDFLFESDNEFGFPRVCSDKDFKVNDLIPFNLSKNPSKIDSNKGVHFFIDDYKFEQIWSRPKNFINLFQQYGGIVSPTFSIWNNQPYALSVYNMYRSRWCVRFYQEFGVKVLVDCRWSDEKTYDIAFSGIAKNSPIIVNTVGTKYLDNRAMFKKGFYEMLKRLEPSDLYVYGEYMPLKFEEYFDSVTYFDSFWKKQRAKIKEKEGNK